MNVTVYNNDDQVVEKFDVRGGEKECADLLNTLDGVNRGYMICRLDDEANVTVIGNGDRYVLTHEVSGVARWLKADGCESEVLVEIVRDDPTKVFRFNMTVSKDHATRALAAICDGHALEEGLYWK